MDSSRESSSPLAAQPTRRVAPSSALLLAIAYSVLAYAVPGAFVLLCFAFLLALLLFGVERDSRLQFNRDLRPKLLTFAILFLVMRFAFEMVDPDAANRLTQSYMLGAIWRAVEAAAQLGSMLLAVSLVLVTTTAASVIRELEEVRVAEGARLYVLVALQYPRQLARRRKLIEEAQRSRGLEPGRRMRDRIRFTLATILPLVQAELDTIGDRVALIHTRGLDISTGGGRGWLRSRAAADWIAIAGAAVMLVIAVTVRVVG